MKLNNLNKKTYSSFWIDPIHIMVMLFLSMPTTVWATALMDEMIIPTKSVLEGQTLRLNGTGVRSVFILDVYLISLYLNSPSNDAVSIVQVDRPAQLRIEFLHGGAGHDMLAKGWRRGFERNQSAAMMIRLNGRLKQFSDLFGDVKKGDVILFDFLSDGDTRISFGGHVQGVIHGLEFQQALLAIWLGRNPVEDDLKKELLQQKELRKQL